MKPAASLIAAALCLLPAVAARAQFALVPAPQVQAAPVASQADTPQDYKKDFARHVYSAYPARIYKGKLPPLLYSVMLTETKLDAQGNVVDVAVIRPPAVAAVSPFIVQLIKRAAPFPAPTRIGEAKVMEIWLVDKSGNFQVDTLTEGQR